MGKLITILIKAYQKISHLFFPPRCRFYPSCSHYTIDAIKKYGTVKGLWKSLGRILRCSPFSSGGYDPA